MVASYVSSSDLVHFLLILRSVLAARRSSEAMQGSASEGCEERCAMAVLTYLASAMGIGKCRQYPSFAAFLAELRRFLAEDLQQQYIDGLCEFLCSIDSHDTLAGQVEKGVALFEVDGSTSQNNLSAPHCITRNSILGVFIRTVLANWECMLFDDLCDTYDSFASFISCTSSSSSSSPWSPSAQTSRPSLLSRAEEKLQQRNISEAEGLIHRYYDSLTDPSTSVQLNFLGRDSGYNVSESLYSLHNGPAEDDKRHVTKNQHSMMSLAVLHMRAHNWPQTAIAIEEALKTAHQRGDHSSVAKCLLFLFQLSQSRGDVSQTDSEEMIRRSMVRASSHSLNDLVALAAIQLAALKSKHAASSSAQRLHSPSSWTADEAWELFNFAMHGESSLTMQFASSKTITTNLDECLIASSSNPAAHLRQHQQSQQAVAANTAEHPSVIDEDYIQRYLVASLHLAEHWLAQNLPLLAAVDLLRALRTFGSRCRPTDQVSLLSKLADVKLNLLRIDELGVFQLQIRAAVQHLSQFVHAPSLEGLELVALKADLLLAIHRGDWWTADFQADRLLAAVQTNSLRDADSMRCEVLAMVVKASARQGVLATAETTAMWEKLERECARCDCKYVLKEPVLVQALEVLWPRSSIGARNAASVPDGKS